MKSNPKKREGFTLIEVIISMAIIAIISVGVYNAYLLLIRQTKDGEVKQTAALEGKEVIEEIKGNTEGRSFDVTDKTSLDLGDINLEKKQIADGSTENYFEKTIYLNQEFEESIDSEKFTDYEYIKTITIKKVKSAEGTNINNKYDIDLDSGKISEPKETEEVNIIKPRFIVTKSAGSEQKSYIQYENENNGKSKEIPKNAEGKIVLNVYIKTIDDKKTIIIKDFDGNELLPPKEESLSTDKVNELDLYINFSEYDKAENEVINNLEINIYNSDAETDKNNHNIYLEKSKDLDIDIKVRKGNINIYTNRVKNTSLINLGTLYNIQVDINKIDKSKNIKSIGEIKKGDILFSGYSNENIYIK